MSATNENTFTFDPPNEILLEIFKHYVNPANRIRKESLRPECQGFASLFLVRSSWRAILQGCPEFLGRVIDWDADHPAKVSNLCSPSSVPTQSLYPQIERYLALSSPFPITIVAGFRQARNEGDRTQKELQRNYELALDHFERCDYLYMAVGAHHFKRRRRFFDTLANSKICNKMKHFTLLWESQGAGGSSVGAAFPNGLKQLTTFQLSGPLSYDTRFLPFSQGIMTHCTTLTILGKMRPHNMEDTEYYPRSWARRLALVPHLTHLTLCHVLIIGDHAMSASTQSAVVLSQLSRLVLAGHLPTCSQLLQALQIPPTCRLIAECVIDSNWGWGLNEFDEAWIPIVQKVPVAPNTMPYKRWAVGFGNELVIQGQDARSKVLFKVVVVYRVPEANDAWTPQNGPRPMSDFFNLWASALCRFQDHPSSTSLFDSADTLCLRTEDIPQSGHPPIMHDSYYVSFFKSFTAVTQLHLASFSPFLWRVLSLHSHDSSPPQGLLPNLRVVKLLSYGFGPSLPLRGARSAYRCLLHFVLERQADIFLGNITKIFIVGDNRLDLNDFRIERSLTMGEGLEMVSCELISEVQAIRYLNWADEGWAWSTFQSGTPFDKYLRTSSY